MPRPPRPPKAATKKRGLSSKELSVIREQSEAGVPPEDIAAAIGRNVDVVIRAAARFRDRATPVVREDPPLPQAVRPVTLGPPPSKRDGIRSVLRSRSEYQLLTRQLTRAELAFFEEQYCDILEQFGDDITPTERAEVNNVVMLMVFMARNAEEQLSARAEAARADREAVRLAGIYPDTDELPRPETYQKRIDDQRKIVRGEESRLNQLTSLYGEMNREQQRLFEHLKSTRNQRLDKATRPKNLQDLLKELMDDERREAVGMRGELMRRSMMQETERLSQPREFADGVVDRPLLTPEVVLASQRRQPKPVGHAVGGGEVVGDARHDGVSACYGEDAAGCDEVAPAD